MRVRSPSRTRWMMRCLAAWTAVRPNCSNGTSSSNTSPGWKSGSSNRASSAVEAVEDPGTQVTLEEARFEDPDFQPGDGLAEGGAVAQFGRTAVQGAKPRISRRG